MVVQLRLFASRGLEALRVLFISKVLGGLLILPVYALLVATSEFTTLRGFSTGFVTVLTFNARFIGWILLHPVIPTHGDIPGGWLYGLVLYAAALATVMAVATQTRAGRRTILAGGKD